MAKFVFHRRLGWIVLIVFLLSTPTWMAVSYFQLGWKHFDPSTTVSRSSISSNHVYHNNNQCTYADLIAIRKSWQERVRNNPHDTLKAKPVSQVPTRSRPFVYFHLRKAGGSTIRQELMHSAKVPQALGGPGLQPDDIWIPCYHQVHCQSYLIPSYQVYSLYAGHLYYTDIQNRLNFREGPTEGLPAYLRPNVAIPPSEPQFDCVIQFRATIDRVGSCWNFRFGQGLSFDRAQKLADNLSPAEWDIFLPKLYSRYREGCNHENVRVLSDIVDEVQVNVLTSSWHHTNHTHSDSSLYAPQQDVCHLQQQLDLMMNRLSQCVVLISDQCEQNKIILQHYVPWFSLQCDVKANQGKFGHSNNDTRVSTSDDHNDDDDDDGNNNSTSTKGNSTIVQLIQDWVSQNVHDMEEYEHSLNQTTKELTPNSAKVLLQHNLLDEELYRLAVTIHAQQYEMASTALANTTNIDS